MCDTYTHTHKHIHILFSTHVHILFSLESPESQHHGQHPHWPNSISGSKNQTGNNRTVHVTTET